MATSSAWKDLLLKKKKANKDSLNLDENQEQYFRFTKISRHSSGQLSYFIYQLIESEKVYIGTLNNAINACIHLSEIKNVGFEEFIERLMLFRNSCQEFLENLKKKNDEKIFISYITSANFYKLYQDYISNYTVDLTKIQKAKNENSRLQIQLKDIDLYLNAPFRRVFFYRAIYWNILRCKNQKIKIDDNKIIHSLNSLVNSIIGCKSDLNIEKDDFMKIAKFEQDLDSSKVDVNGEITAIFTYLCNGINTSPIENTPSIINSFNLEKIIINNSDFEKSVKENITITIFSDFLIITKDTYSQKSGKDSNNSFLNDSNENIKVKSQLLYPPIPLKDVSIAERKVPRYLQKLNHILIDSNGGYDSIKLKNLEVDESELTYTDFLFELRCTNPQIFIVLQAENDKDREDFRTSINSQKNYILNDNHEIYFDNLGQFVLVTLNSNVPKTDIEGDISNIIYDNEKSFSNISINVENPLNDNENIDLSSREKNEIQNLTAFNDNKFLNTTLFQALCTPYYFKQNEWIQMPKSIICIHQSSDGRNFISLNASATGRTLLNEYICPDSVIKESSKNENVIQIKTKSRGLFSLRFGKYGTVSYNTLLNFSRNLINDSIYWNYEKKEDLLLIERSQPLDITYNLVIKNNIDDSSSAFKLYCEKTTKYEIFNQLYVKEKNNWISLGFSKINFVIPTYIMGNDFDNSENLVDMDLLKRNSIEPIITAHSVINMKKSGSNKLICFLRAPINQDCIILKNRNIHEDNVYELNFMYEERIYEYMIYAKKTDKSLAFISEFVNKLSNYYSKVLENRDDISKEPSLLIEPTEKANSSNSIEIVDNKKEDVINSNSNNDILEKKELINDNNDNENNNDNNNEYKPNDRHDNSNAENNLLSGFTFMSTNNRPPLSSQIQQKQEKAPFENKIMFNMNDFSMDTSIKEKKVEKTQNSTSIFSGFSLFSNSNNISDTNKKKEDQNNILTNSLFTNKPKFSFPSPDANSFGFSFNNKPIIPQASISNDSDKSISNSIKFTFNSNNTLANTSTDSKSEKINTDSKKHDIKKDNEEQVKSKQDELSDENEVIETTQDEIPINQDKKEEIKAIQDEIPISEDKKEEIKAIQDEIPISEDKKEKIITKSTNDISSANIGTQNSEIEASMSCTLYDISEPYNSPSNEAKKPADKIKDIDYEDFNDINAIKNGNGNGKLLSLKFNHFIRSCDDLYIRAQNIDVSFNQDTFNYMGSMKDIIMDSIYNLKKGTKLLNSLVNVSDSSIITINGENSNSLYFNEPLSSNCNKLKKRRSISEMEMKSFKEYDIIVNNNQQWIQNSINDFKSSLSITNEKSSEIKNLKNKSTSKNLMEDENNIINKSLIKIDNQEIDIENKINIKDEIKKYDLNEYKKEDSIIISETKNKINNEKNTKTGIVANLISNINNNSNNSQKNIKKEESFTNQHHVDKMAKEYMEELNNNNNQTFIKSEKVKCLRLTPASNENMTNEELLSLYIKSLRPIKKQNEKSDNNDDVNKVKKNDLSLKDKFTSYKYENNKNGSSCTTSNAIDTITSYYKYANNGKIEMTSTGNMNIKEAFNLLRYKIKILRKQLEIEKKTREDITEDYIALREELKEWMKKSDLINESFIIERDVNMEKEDYIQLLEEKIRTYENLIQRHNEIYSNSTLANVENQQNSIENNE